MSLVWIDEDWDEEIHVEDGGKFESLRFFTCQMSSITDTEQAILRARPDLAPYSAHPSRPDALVVDFFAKRERGSTLLRLQVQYSTEYEQIANPLSQAAIITTGREARTEITLVDGEGNPIVNAAGDLIDDPPCERTVSLLVFHVRKNIPAGTLPQWALDYSDSVNEDSVRLKGKPCDPETLLFVYGGTGDDQTIGGTSFCEISFDLIYRADGWREAIPNRGFYQLIDAKRTMTQAQPGDQVVSNTKRQSLIRRRIYVREGNDSNGLLVPCTEPQMLDLQGKYIERPTLKNIVILTPLLNPKLPFNALPIK